MYNSQINNFINNLIAQAENHTDCLKNIISCLKGYFTTPQESENENDIKYGNKNVLVPFINTSKQEDNMIIYKGIRINKRKSDNRWFFRIKTYTNTYKYFYAKTQNDCLNLLKDYIKENGQNTNKKQISYQKATTLNDWLDEWLQLYKINKVKPNTIKSYKSAIKNHISKDIGKKELTKITTIDIISKLNSLNGRTAQKVYDILKDSFTKAYINKKIKENIVNATEKPKHLKTITKYLDIEQEKMFEEECKKRNNIYADYLLILLYQGMRFSEPKTLYDYNLDFVNRTISIDEKIDKKLYVKTNNSNRTVPMFSNTYKVLIKYKNVKGQIFKIGTNKIYQELEEICKKLKIDNVTPTSLRHTFITRVSENKSIPEHILQRWVGHTIGSKITKNVYTHNDPIIEEKFIKEFDTNFDTKK